MVLSEGLFFWLRGGGQKDTVKHGPLILNVPWFRKAQCKFYSAKMCRIVSRIKFTQLKGYSNSLPSRCRLKIKKVITWISSILNWRVGELQQIYIGPDNFSQ